MQKETGSASGCLVPGDIARTLSARYYKDGSEILIRRGRGNPRRLTRASVPGSWDSTGRARPPFTIPVSDTRAYKQFGNAVVVPVVEAVARHIAPWIGVGEDTGKSSSSGFLLDDGHRDQRSAAA